LSDINLFLWLATVSDGHSSHHHCVIALQPSQRHIIWPFPWSSTSYQK
jgi:hypothetical protein